MLVSRVQQSVGCASRTWSVWKTTFERIDLWARYLTQWQSVVDVNHVHFMFSGQGHTRDVQKVRRLTQLIIRYVPVHHILSLFNVVSCNWNALGPTKCIVGPAFLQSSDAVVEELLILLFQSAFCRADNVSPQNCPFALGIWTSIWHMVPWAHPSPHPKRYLDRFRRFCRAEDCDRQTDHATPSVTI